MTEEQMNYIRHQDPGILLLKAKKDIQGRHSYICPVCGNGSGTNGTGITSKDGIHWKCFRCGFSGDFIDIVAEVEHLEKGSREAIERAGEICGSGDPEPAPAQPIPERKTERPDYSREYERSIQADAYTDEAKEYFKTRGFEWYTAQKYGVGYDAGEKAVLFPYRLKDDKNKIGYVRRFIYKEGDDKARDSRGSGTGFTGYEAAMKNNVVFICEGGFDWLSCVSLGMQAVSLNSVSNVNAFLDRTNKTGSKVRSFVLCLDNDDPGRIASQKLGVELTGKGFYVYKLELPKEYHDINEMYTQNREGLRTLLNDAYSKVSEDPQQREMRSHSVRELYPQFLEYVANDKNNEPITTGFKDLDRAIGGGLIPGLYVIGAVSTIGKTTFALQIADNVAKSGKHVIIFSLEMAKENIIARSISRETYLTCLEEGKNTGTAKTEYGVLIGYNYNRYTDDEKNLIRRAGERYINYAGDRISIYDGRRTADDIKKIVSEYISRTEEHPVVIVDYMQLIAPTDKTASSSDKTQTDYNVSILTDIKRDLKCPVIAISAFNRSSYTTVANDASFKESGTIEYTADCTMSLEYVIDMISKGSAKAIENDTNAKITEAKTKVPREIRLTLLKNRGNMAGTKLYFLYNPLFNYFEPDWRKQ